MLVQAPRSLATLVALEGVQLVVLGIGALAVVALVPVALVLRRRDARQRALTDAKTDDRFRLALDAMLDNVVIARAIRDQQGHIADFVVAHVNARAAADLGRMAQDMIGKSVRELWPDWSSSSVFLRYVDVVDGGPPLVAPRLPRPRSQPDGSAPAWFSLQVTAFGDGYLAVWREVTDEVHREQQLAAAREAALTESTSVRVLQQASLPPFFPQVPGVGIVARYLPAMAATPVGGDWYDAFLLDDGRLGLVVADIAGHGLEAAAQMVQLRNKLRGVAFAGDAPGIVMERYSLLTTRTGTLATCCYAVLDPAQRVLQWANAGHLPPVKVGAGGAQILVSRPDPLLGLGGRWAYTTHEQQLCSGDTLLLYTDGLVERRGEVIDDGLARLVAQLAEPQSDLDQLADELVAKVRDPLHLDDVCLLLARIS